MKEQRMTINENELTYELIGTPRIEAEYSDDYETTMSCDLRRTDGVSGDVWIVAGVPDYLRGTADAARTQRGYETVRVFGGSPDHWCPESFRPADDDYSDVRDGVIAACESTALRVHRDRRQTSEARR